MQHEPDHLEKQADRAMVVTPHPQAALAAERVLSSGGNAADAAVASILTLCVVAPGMVSLGGYGGSAVIYSARERKMVAIDFTGAAPLRYDHQLYRSTPAAAETGPLSIMVPAVLAGLDLLLRRYGTLSWRDIVGHAQRLAEEGFSLTSSLRSNLGSWIEKTDAVSIRALLGDQPLPNVGEPFVQKDLAGLIRRIGEEGPAALYQGDVPRIICRQIQQSGGILAEEDFHRYEPIETEPIEIDYRQHQLVTPPPPSGGVTTLSILKTLEQFDLATLPHLGTEYFHLVAEAAKLCWRERRETLGDPRFVTVPLEQMLSETSAVARAQRIVDSELPAPLPPLDPEAAHTANVLAADAEGNVVSLTATNGSGFGSQLVIDGLGLFMNHGMSRFSLDPSSPNAAAPGKRPQHNMVPMIVMQNRRPRHAIGLPGGTRIVTVTAQVAVSLVDYRTSPADAVRSPRLHVDTDEPISVSGNMPRETLDGLVARGHRIEGADVGGTINAISIGADGELTGATAAGADGICAL